MRGGGGASASTLAIETRTLVADGPGTLPTEGLLVSALLKLGEYAETKQPGRGTLEKRRRLLGPDHRDTLVTAADLATALAKQGKHAKAVELSARCSSPQPGYSAQSTRRR